jgi:uncharacterized protein DUF664
MTTSTEIPGQIELPIAGSEVDTLLGALDRNRRTFAWKCFGLSADEMRRTLGASTMTLAGLVKHVALVEDSPQELQALWEYARHTGHADLIRESIDGLVGEGLPLEEFAQ